MRRGRLLLVALLGVGLAAGAATLAAVQGQERKESSSVTGGTPEPPKRDRWHHPRTGEEVTLRFEDGRTRLERGGKVSEQEPPPFDEAAAREETRAQMLAGGWSPFELRILREIAQAGTLRENGRSLRVADLGFPPRLWEELDAFERKLEQQGGSTFPAPDTPADSPLWYPTPEMRERFAELMALVAEGVQIHPPSADTPFHEQRQRLAREGFVRLSARRPDGSLWLPPELEPQRPALERWERPVVRPVVAPGTPAPWESKLGGVPYRPKGAAWPTQASGSPLSFLAQIDLGVANARGHLPELPRRGLLQFFLAHSEATYEQAVKDPELGNPVARVLYWPDPQRDEATLTREVPALADEFQAEMFSPPERALDFLEDREFPSLIDDRVKEVKSEVESSDLHPNGHRLGGHAMLINAYFPADQDWRLLFQFDGDDVGGQIYGEYGGLGGWIGFFMRAEDLARRDFSRVRVELDAF